MQVPAPNTAGLYKVHTSQVVAGERFGDVEVGLDYGKPLIVDLPVEGATHNTTGPLAMSGTGDPDARITVRDQGKSGVLGTGYVRANGGWSFDTDSLPGGKRMTLEIRQESKGGNVPTQTRTINPDAQDEVAPLVIEKPSEGGVVVAPTGDVEFSGTGETGAGSWSAVGHNLNPNTHYTLETVYTVPDQAPVNGTISFTTTPSEGVEQDFTIDTPAEGATVVTPNGDVDFAGKGTTGADVIIRGMNGGRTIGTGKVDALGNWAFTGHNLNTNTNYTLETVYRAPGADEVTGTITFTTTPSK